jgi:DeoR family fructose operon transcriptional repressor
MDYNHLPYRPRLRPNGAPHPNPVARPTMGNLVRQRKLADLIAESGECSIEKLARELGVSDMTIRRDLEVLSRTGKVIRTHGGAVRAERVSFEFEFLKRSEENQSAKEAIAQLAATKVKDGQSVLLDSGTTTLALADQLRGKKDLTVVTTALPIASALQFSPEIEILLLGGYVRASSPDLGGALTESNLETLCADVAFIGTYGIDVKGGVYQNSPEVARLVSKMIKAAKEAYVVADSTKFSKTALCRFGRLQDFAGLITDRGADAKLVSALRKKGAQVFLA